MALVFTSALAGNLDPFFRGLAAELTRAGFGTARFFGPRDWAARRRALAAGEAALAPVCGVEYARDAADPRPALAPVAAPIPAGPGYRGAPVYFTDVVVARGARFRRWEDLRGGRWAYNEIGSFSGSLAVAGLLDAGGHRRDFFGTAQRTGAHLESLERVLAGEADAAGLDSTTYDLARRRRPELGTRLRVLRRVGPHPAPLVVARRDLPPEVRDRLAAALTGLGGHPAGRRLLGLAGFRGFRAVADADYDPLRRWVSRAAGVRFAPDAPPCPGLPGEGAGRGG